MTHGEQRLWLIQQLLNERNDAAGVQIPEDEQGQKDLLRGLMNIRMPDPIDAEFLRIQDEYLTEENLAEGVVKIEDLTPIKLIIGFISGREICPGLPLTLLHYQPTPDSQDAINIYTIVWITFLVRKQGLS